MLNDDDLYALNGFDMTEELLLAKQNETINASTLMHLLLEDTGDFIASLKHGEISSLENAEFIEDKKNDAALDSEEDNNNEATLTELIYSHAIFMSGSHRMMLSFDRLACPMPDRKARHLERVLNVGKTINYWGETLPPTLYHYTKKMANNQIDTVNRYIKRNMKDKL